MAQIKKKFIDFGTGTDEVNSRDLPANYTPTNYTPVAVGSEGTDKVSSHLKGINNALATAGSIFSDDTFRIQDDLDPTKEIAFSAGSIATGTTRTITMANANVDLAKVNTAVQRDGSVAMTGNLDMNGNQIGGVAAGTNALDAVNFTQLGTKPNTNTVLLLNGSGTMTGNIDMGGFQVANMAAGTNPGDAVNLTQLNTKQATGNYITALTGDVTAAGPGSVAATIANNAVTNAKLAQVATATFKGRTTAGTGNVEDLTVSQVQALLNSSTGDISPTVWNGLADNTANQVITGFAFANGTIRSFDSTISFAIDATTDLFVQYKICGIQRGSDWQITTELVGDDVPGVSFNITSAGQVRISVGSITGFSSAKAVFRAIVTQV